MIYPVYGLRDYEEIEARDGLIFVTTYYKEWIIDIENDDPDYFSRRLTILIKYGKNSLYPLRYRCENFSDVYQLRKSKNVKRFIDSHGVIHNYIPSKNIKCKWIKPTYIKSKCGSLFVDVDGVLLDVPNQYKWVLVGYIKSSPMIMGLQDEDPSKLTVTRKI